jgi:hypothetical protein
MLLPLDRKTMSATLDAHPISTTLRRIEDSTYLVLPFISSGVHRLEVELASSSTAEWHAGCTCADNRLLGPFETSRQVAGKATIRPSGKPPPEFSEPHPVSHYRSSLDLATNSFIGAHNEWRRRRGA